MPPTDAPLVGPPSLLSITVRRSIVTGRVYVVVGIALSSLYAVIFNVVPGDSFVTVFPVLLPILAVTGGLGGLMVFTSDRTKGVFEYLLAYGVSPYRIFTNVLVASLVAVTIVLAVATGLGLGINFAAHHTVPVSVIGALAGYSYPMGYVSVAFAATAGMFWTSLSTPRAGINSPIGLVPLVGIAPPLLTLIIAVSVQATSVVPAWVVTTAAILAVALAVLLLLSLSGRFLRRERLLSPT